MVAVGFGQGITRRRVLAGSAAFLGSAAMTSLLRRSSLTAIVVDQMRSAKIPGLALGIARHGRVLSAEGHGFADLELRRPVTADSMFHVASVTKTVTATAIMMLVDAGRLGLDDAIDDHLDFVVRNPVHPATPITVRHLLMHVSSISDDTYYEIDFRTPNADSTLLLRTFLKDYLATTGAETPASSPRSTSTQSQRRVSRC